MSMPEPRGFRYSLQPLRTKCNWDLLALQQDLSHCRQDIKACQDLAWQLETDRNCALDRLSQLHAQQRTFFADSQRLLHAYIDQQTQALSKAKAKLDQHEVRRDQLVAEIHRLQKFADALEQDHSDSVREHLRGQDKQASQEADDAWLRRKFGRMGT